MRLPFRMGRPHVLNIIFGWVRFPRDQTCFVDDVVKIEALEQRSTRGVAVLFASAGNRIICVMRRLVRRSGSILWNPGDRRFAFCDGRRDSLPGRRRHASVHAARVFYISMCGHVKNLCGWKTIKKFVCGSNVALDLMVARRRAKLACYFATAPSDYRVCQVRFLFFALD